MVPVCQRSPPAWPALGWDSGGWAEPHAQWGDGSGGVLLRPCSTPKVTPLFFIHFAPGPEASSISLEVRPRSSYTLVCIVTVLSPW